MEVVGISGELSAWNPAKKRSTQNVNSGFNDVLGESKMSVWHNGKPLEEWAGEDEIYTDAESGISWHVRDGKYPYMTGEDAERFRRLCEETGEFPAKKFAEMTGLIRTLDDNTTAYVGDNGLGIKGKDGRELFVSTANMSYGSVMKMFDSLQKPNHYFDLNYWRAQMKNRR